MGEWFQGLIDGVWNFFTFFWDVLAAAFMTIMGWFWEVVLFIFMLPLQVPIYLWNNLTKPALQDLLAKINEVDYVSTIGSIDLGPFNVGGLLVALVDWNYVIPIAGGCGALLIVIALMKFTIKLIPGIG